MYIVLDPRGDALLGHDNTQRQTVKTLSNRICNQLACPGRPYSIVVITNLERRNPIIEIVALNNHPDEESVTTYVLVNKATLLGLGCAQSIMLHYFTQRYHGTVASLALGNKHSLGSRS